MLEWRRVASWAARWGWRAWWWAACSVGWKGHWPAAKLDAPTAVLMAEHWVCSVVGVTVAWKAGQMAVRWVVGTAGLMADQRADWWEWWVSR